VTRALDDNVLSSLISWHKPLGAGEIVYPAQELRQPSFIGHGLKPFDVVCRPVDAVIDRIMECPHQISRLLDDVPAVALERCLYLS
jgi:hypothetical protein